MSGKKTEGHNRPVDVQKICLGDHKIVYAISNRFFINERDEQDKRIWKELLPEEIAVLAGENGSFRPQEAYANERITLGAHDLFLSIASRKGFFRRQQRILCNHISFRAEPGTMTGIIGPSGAGKTVLLNLLSGYAHSKQNEGRVFINDTVDVHKDRQILGRAMGYLPQDDILISQLTVWQYLTYCFRLRYAGVEDDLKAAIIQDICRKSGFSEQEMETLFQSRIGSPEERILSGGERKRTSIAHELLQHPLILFLDEPTSGLASVDADMVMASLRNLCDTTGMTIILTIHQPGIESFEKLDRVLVLNHGGNIAYFGDMQDTVPYFQEHVPQLSYQENQNPAEFILKALDTWTATLRQTGNNENTPEEKIAEVYKQNPHYFPFEITEPLLVTLQSDSMSDAILGKLQGIKGQRFFWRKDFLTAIEGVVGEEHTQEIENIVKHVVQSGNSNLFPKTIKQESDQPLRQLRTSVLHQFWVLLSRNFAIARTDINNRRFQILQPIVIGILMLLTFAWYTQDYYGEDIFSRVGYELTEKLGRETIVLTEDLPKMKERAYYETVLIGEDSANRRAGVFFVLIAACIWFGLISSCQEIVNESTVLKREAKSTLKISSYLSAKVVFLAWICSKQVLLLLIVVYLPNLILVSNDIPSNIKRFFLTTQLLTHIPIVGIFLILWITAVFASWIGLSISVFASTQKVALTMVPLILIPQLLLGGLIRPIKDIDNSQSFIISPLVLSQLKSEKISIDLLEKLEKMQNQRFTEEKDFLFAIETVIGEKPKTPLKQLLLNHARVQSFRGRESFPFYFHDLILQKWAFKATLLYDSSGNIEILKKIVDVTQYNEYEYLQFEIVKIVEMFFGEKKLPQFTKQEYETFLSQFPSAEKVLEPHVQKDQDKVYIAIEEISKKQKRELKEEAFTWLTKHIETFAQAKRREELYYILLKVTILHIVVLLIPTYLWLTRKLQY